jgi:hypothetical protein
MEAKSLSLELLLALSIDSTQAGRPLAIDDATPVAPWQVEIEMGAGYVGNDRMHHWDFPVAATLGLGWNLELGIGSGGQLEERDELASGDNPVSGIQDLLFSSKWMVLAETDRQPAQSLVFSMKVPTASRRRGLGSGEPDYDLTWIASKSFGERFSVHVNLGYSWLGDPPGENFPDVLHYGAALGYFVNEEVEFVAELYADTPVEDDNTAVLFNAGVRWQAAAGLILDVALGAGLTREAPDLIATVGFTWTFGLN